MRSTTSTGPARTLPAFPFYRLNWRRSNCVLREMMPNAAMFGVLVDPAFPGIQSNIADLQAAARTLGLQLLVVNARTDSDLEPAWRH
jgi:ABC-type uncharacterized transport system substrate-binding protein